MTWTIEQKLESLLRLPWTIVSEVSPEGDRLLRVGEIPSAVGTGVEDLEMESDLWESLRASLASYLHFDDPIPLPEGEVLPWSTDSRRGVEPLVAMSVRQRLNSITEEPIHAPDPTGGAAEWENPALVAA